TGSSYFGGPGGRRHGCEFRGEAATDLQRLFSVSIARTDGECKSVGPGGLAGLERARGNSVCGCAASLAARSARVVKHQPERSDAARVGHTVGGGRALDPAA